MIDVETLVQKDHPPFLITTRDNPYNPWTDFDSWYNWDETMGYRTSEYVARVCWYADDLPEEEEDIALMLAMEEILALNVTGNYHKIYPDTKTIRTSVNSDMF